MYELHRYQHEAKAAVRAAWDAGTSRPAIVLPTGTGKTVVFTSLSTELVAEGRRVLVLVHRDELVQQTVAKMRAFGATSVGVVKAQQDETDATVIVASVQTLFRGARTLRLARALRTHPFVVLCDEAHHYTAKAYRKVLDQLGVFDPVTPTPAVGFTATFVRTDSRHLADDWTPVYEKTVSWAIEHGFLCDLEAVSVRVPDLNLDKASRSGGDYTDVGLGQQLQDSSAAEVIPAAWAKYAPGKRTILFAPTIASCEELVAGFGLAGVKAEAVYGGTPLDERRAIYDRVRAGTTLVLASVGVLTEGFDMPEIECAVMARPTQSRGLYQQMVGRILRTFPGKDTAILLDIVGDAIAHDLCNVTDLTKTHDGHVGGDEAKTPQNCLCGWGMGGTCECQTRGNCTRMQNLGLCLCDGCDCPSSGDRGAVKLVRGSKDVHVDVFRGSSSVWLRTYAGTWFIGTRECLVAVLQRDEGWVPVRTHDARTLTTGSAGTKAAYLGVASDLETAMTVAQEYATATDPQIVAKGSAWRRRKPSEGQVRFASSIGLPVEDGVKAGPISDALSRYTASRVLDR